MVAMSMTGWCGLCSLFFVFKTLQALSLSLLKTECVGLLSGFQLRSLDFKTSLYLVYDCLETDALFVEVLENADLDRISPNRSVSKGLSYSPEPRLKYFSVFKLTG